MLWEVVDEWSTYSWRMVIQPEDEFSGSPDDLENGYVDIPPAFLDEESNSDE